jgi:hypothetical protein
MARTVLRAVVAAVVLGLHRLNGPGGAGAADGDVRQGQTGEPLAPDGAPADETGDEPDDLPVEAPSGADATPPVPPEIPPPPVH